MCADYKVDMVWGRSYESFTVIPTNIFQHENFVIQSFITVKIFGLWYCLVSLHVNTLHNSNPLHVTKLDALRGWVRKLIFTYVQNNCFQYDELQRLTVVIIPIWMSCTWWKECANQVSFVGRLYKRQWGLESCSNARGNSLLNHGWLGEMERHLTLESSGELFLRLISVIPWHICTAYLHDIVHSVVKVFQPEPWISDFYFPLVL